MRPSSSNSRWGTEDVPIEMLRELADPGQQGGGLTHLSFTEMQSIQFNAGPPTFCRWPHRGLQRDAIGCTVVSVPDCLLKLGLTFLCLSVLSRAKIPSILTPFCTRQYTQGRPGGCCRQRILETSPGPFLGHQARSETVHLIASSRMPRVP